MIKNIPKNIVFFDGVCNLCNGLVNFLWKIDHEHKLHYSSLQSEFAKDFLKDQQIDSQHLNTIYFYTSGKYHKKSRAVGHIFLLLKTPFWILGKIILFFPVGFADVIYSFIAKYRYKFWGKSDTCRIPISEEKGYFIEKTI